MQANDEEPVDVRARRRLRELRTERGMTLREVADRANIDLSTLSRLESGKRRLALDHVPALAAALGVSTDELLQTTQRDPRVRGRPRKRKGLTMWPLTRQGRPPGCTRSRSTSTRVATCRPRSSRCMTGTTGSTSSTAGSG